MKADEFDMIVVQRRLYKRGVKGEIRVWRMELGGTSPDPKKHDAGYRVVTGILHGKETKSGWTVCKPKNKGRKNATTSHEQAKAEIAAHYKKKRERGYFDNIEDVDDVTFVKPMLAVDWQKRKTKVDMSEGVFAQPKLDGIRCIGRNDGLWTRAGKPIVACPHIEAALAPIFERNPDYVFDGELYNHDLRYDFNSITSVVRKTKPSDADVRKAAELIEYHIYDMVDEDRVFSKRWSAVDNMVRQDSSPHLHLVQTKQVTDGDTLDALYGRWLQDGYEGQMIRINVEYENKRSNMLLKRKEFMTDEFPVTAMYEGEGNWSGAIKRFTLALPTGQEFGSGVRGKHDELAKLLEEGNCPKWATVRYFTPTPDGIPRFPVVIDYGFEPCRAD